MRFPAKTMTLTALFAVLTAVGAFIRVPFPPVPITLQTLFVFLSGTLLGSRMGALSQILYVGMGLIGLPVFTGGGGPQYILHPTFGYLLGFIAGAWTIGFISERARKNSFTVFMIACLSGTAVIYSLGAAGLYINLNYVAGKATTLRQVLEFGVIPFVAGDILKMLGTAVLASRVKDRLTRV
ncbi:MAG TPA: biotin transporter BioY [Synergistales bacterium]|nr:biotin transporter BioY [Synergistales bacterium]HRV71730.1 biotin transporter BioY [Thermovirgaceae bacterium]